MLNFNIGFDQNRPGKSWSSQIAFDCSNAITLKQHVDCCGALKRSKNYTETVPLLENLIFQIQRAKNTNSSVICILSYMIDSVDNLYIYKK